MTASSTRLSAVERLAEVALGQAQQVVRVLDEQRPVRARAARA